MHYLSKKIHYGFQVLANLQIKFHRKSCYVRIEQMVLANVLLPALQFVKYMASHAEK